MRGTDATLMALGTCEYENANDESHACDLVQAHLIETLSSIGREHIDFYFFRVQRMAEEFQLSGALQALELAKQEGHIGHIGICCDGPSFATLGAWQFHDAFEVLLVERNHFDSESYNTLAPLAKERRVGVVTNDPLNWRKGQPFVDQPELWEPPIFSEALTQQALSQAVISDLASDHPVLVAVNSPDQVRWVLDSFSESRGDDLPQILAPAIQLFNSWGNK